jgi:hypothetical protein
MGPGCPGCVCLHVYCLFTQSARTATRSYLHSGDSCAAREAVIDTRVPREPVCCHDASKTQVVDKLVLRQGVGQASAALPNRPGQPSSRRHANPAKQGFRIRECSQCGPCWAQKGRTKQKTCQNRGEFCRGGTSRRCCSINAGWWALATAGEAWCLHG